MAKKLACYYPALQLVSSFDELSLSIKNSEPEVILVDSELLQSLSLSVIKALRECSSRTDMAIVLLTHVVMKEFTAAEQLNVNDIIVKPIRSAELARMIQWKECQNPMPSNDVSHNSGMVQTGSLKGINLLVADDQDANRVLAKLILERADANVTLVEDGKLAVSAAAFQQYDCILMDLQMPNMGGIEATQAIRQSTGKSCNTPIIALTAKVLAEDKAQCLNVGMNDFLTKPLDAPNLLMTILQHISGEKTTLVEPNFTPIPREFSSTTIVDVENGIALWQGEESLYWKKLIEFNKNSLGLVKGIQLKLEAVDYAAAAAIAHNINGQAGNLAIPKLQRAAKLIETDLDNYEKGSLVTENTLDQRLQDLSLAQTQLTEFICKNKEKLNSPSIGDDNSLELDNAQFFQQLKVFARQLAQADLDALEGISILNSFWSGSIDIHQELSQLESELTHFNFEAAHKLLMKIVVKKKIDIGMEI